MIQISDSLSIDHTASLRHPKLVAFEGIDGSGKSTQIRLVAEKLKASGFEVLCLQEPTSLSSGLALRKRLATSAQAPLDPAEELELFLEDRLQDNNCLIKPALWSKKIVLIDRYIYSTIAYQGRKLPLVELITANMRFDFMWPGLTVYLDLPLSASQHRLEKRYSQKQASGPEMLNHHDHNLDCYLEESHIQKQVYANYQALLNWDKQMLPFDALLPKAELGQRIYQVIVDFLAKNGVNE